MQTLGRLKKTSSRRAFLLALVILSISVIAATVSAFPASVSRNFAVTARVVRGCGVSTSRSELGNSEIVVNQTMTVPQLGPVLTVTCARGAARHVVISTRNDTPGTLVELTPSGDVTKQTLPIQIEASPTKIPTEAAEQDRNSRAKTPGNRRYFAFGGKLAGRENLSPDNGGDIVVVTVEF